jgi:hypothetical protein
MKIKSIKKANTLTIGGGFSLENGAGMLVGNRVGRSLSNKCAMSLSISAWVKAISKKEIIRSE